MKTATFAEGILLALLTSLVSSVLLFSLSSLFSSSVLIHLIISGITLGYILYLLSRSKERVGRVIFITTWLIGITCLWFAWPPLTFFILGHVISIWLVRSLYFYSSLVSSLMDLALNCFSVAIAFAVASHTNSLFLTLWCFFLSQALFVMIPKSISKSTRNTSTHLNNHDDFQQSFRVAEAAVQQLSNKQ